MKRFVVLSMIVAVAATMPLMAGEGHKCSHSTQDCLNHMATHLKDRGWVGIEYEPETMEVTAVIPGSPAEKAGFQKGDVMVALNGVVFADASKDDMKKAQKSMTPGNQVTYTVTRSGKKAALDVTLAQLPESVLAQWVGNHMIEDHAEVQIASAK